MSNISTARKAELNQELADYQDRAKRFVNRITTNELTDLGKAVAAAMDAIREGDHGKARDALNDLGGIIDGHEDSNVVPIRQTAVSVSETPIPGNTDTDTASASECYAALMERWMEQHNRTPVGKWRTAEERKELVPSADPLLKTETDGCVIAHRRSTALCGDPGCGKTTLALIAAIEACRAGARAVIWNHEEGHKFGTVELQQKLEQLEPDTSVWWDSIQVVEPANGWTDEDLDFIREIMIQWMLAADKPEHSLAIIDSASKAKGAPKNPTEYQDWFTAYIESITKHGIGVICIAHEPKNPEAKRGPLGSILAKAFFQNVFRMTCLKGQRMWGYETAGEATIISLKERYLDSKISAVAAIATLHIEPVDGQLKYSFQTPESKTPQDSKPKRRTFDELKEQIFALVDKQPNKTWDLSYETVCKRLGCGKPNAIKAFAALVAAGRLDADKTRSPHRHTVAGIGIGIDRY